MALSTLKLALGGLGGEETELVSPPKKNKVPRLPRQPISSTGKYYLLTSTLTFACVCWSSWTGSMTMWQK